MTPSNANTSGLASCPFCGGEAWLNDYEAKHSDLPPMSRAPQCRSCGASLGYLPTAAKASKAWNRRVNGSAPGHVPDDYVMVPREPTGAMLKAAFAAMNATPSGTWKRMKAEARHPIQIFNAKMRPRWAAMIRAALQQETQP